jgi:hypothetical protein
MAVAYRMDSPETGNPPAQRRGHLPVVPQRLWYALALVVHGIYVVELRPGSWRCWRTWAKGPIILVIFGTGGSMSVSFRWVPEEAQCSDFSEVP